MTCKMGKEFLFHIKFLIAITLDITLKIHSKVGAHSVCGKTKHCPLLLAITLWVSCFACSMLSATEIGRA